MSENTSGVGACPKCGGEVKYGMYGAYCADKCGMYLNKAFRHVFSKEEITSLLHEKKTLVKGLISKEGNEFDAYLTVKGYIDRSFQSMDGQEKLGYFLNFDMEFPEKKDEEFAISEEDEMPF